MKPEIVDVIVVGSGAAGLSAALSAQHAGAQTLLLERSDKLGGTTAVSAGVPWIPNNHHMHEVGAKDSRDKALTYLRSLSIGGMDLALAETYVDEAPGVLRFIEEQTPLQFAAVLLPDYHPEHPGGGFGRSLSVNLFPSEQLGELRDHIRPSPTFPIPLTMADFEDGTDLFDPVIMGERLAKGLVGTGRALVAGLVKGACDKGVQIRRNVRARRLLIERGRVIGVEGEGEAGIVRVGARCAVILASGGFEWNPGLVDRLVSGPIEGPLSPPFNEGDGLVMAMEAQAALANSKEAWWGPMIQIPGEEYEGRQLGRLVNIERASPRSIVVNRAGKRFVNEAQNYNDVGRMMHNFDAMTFDYPNLPAWMIVDHGYLERYGFATRYPGDPVPSWLVAAPTVRDLASKIGVDANGLDATIRRFNDCAAHGEDSDFGRGRSAYDLYYGDRTFEGAKRTLGPLDQPPFYACRLYSGALGTKGGVRINSRSQVLNGRGESIAGLYAAGNVSGGFLGMAYPGAGSTIGPAMVFGHIAGREAAAGDRADIDGFS